MTTPSTTVKCTMISWQLGPYILTEIVHEAVQAVKEQPGHPRRVEQETYVNTTLKNRKLIDTEAKVIHMILNGIGDGKYSTVDACSTTREMWIAIIRLRQGEAIKKQDVKTKLFWEFGKFNSRDGESIESYYSRFYKMMNKMVRNKLKVDTMRVDVQFLQQICCGCRKGLLQEVLQLPRQCT
ncbi:hypothetical protein Tco_0746617 [Tanacetum coccineum]